MRVDVMDVSNSALVRILTYRVLGAMLSRDSRDIPSNGLVQILT